MNRKSWGLFVGLCVLAFSAVWVVPAGAQMSQGKEKPRMYSYIANWTIPRAQWGDMQKAFGPTQQVMDQSLANGTLVGYGNDENLVHQPDGETHDNFWSAMSMAGLMTVLDQLYSNGSATSPVLASATKHWDEIYVSQHYNWHPGSWKGVYTYVSFYKLKADAPDDAVDLISDNIVAPLLEKMLADGTIHEYEIDTQAVHTEAPDSFVIAYICANAAGLDKVQAAIRDTLKTNPLVGPAFGSMIDFSAHRDELLRTNATYK